MQGQEKGRISSLELEHPSETAKFLNPGQESFQVAIGENGLWARKEQKDGKDINLEGAKDDDVTVYKVCEESLADPGKSVGFKFRRFTGIGLALVSCCAHALSSLILKYLKDYHPLTKSWWRFQGIVFPIIPILFYKSCYEKAPIFKDVWPVSKAENRKNVYWLLVRSASGFANITFQIFALHYISLADQMVISSSQPVFVSVIAYFLLGEACGVVPVFTCIITILGVSIVTRPPILTGEEAFDMNTIIGSVFALVSMMAASFSVAFMRRLKHLYFAVITFTFGFNASIWSLIGAVVWGVVEFPRNTTDALLTLAIIMLVFIAQTTMTLALHYEQAGPVALVRTSQILFAFLWQYLFLGVVPDLFSWLGGLIILIGVVITGARKWVSTLSKTDPTQKKFAFLLK